MLAALQPARRRRRRPGKLRGLKIRVNLRPQKNSKDGSVLFGIDRGRYSDWSAVWAFYASLHLP